ncbi:TetR/AcrR family transcriptional regulator [Streptomyces spinoverrucosus]|uniref:TetR/AcrR family transcriptional regulator n=1 Tax=Streptomyces spinoverrucosus TaxID=284043 RepID=UPI0018C3C8A0|nr:TetR/AcrR family transcriptional regulator [Streptomyces spinoverrucosus]MBG0851767.1 TetR/AcrR family transcriptional regulator [Streptomyces spinoverrucosus]
MARTPAPGTRRRILNVASRLFSENGVRAVGMQQVIEETGVGKSLLYREFPSKDELVAAWIRQSDEEWWAQARKVTQPHEGDPVGQILALMRFFYDSVDQPDFRGCIYYNTSSEFRDPTHPGRREARQHLQKLRDWLRDLAVSAGADDPDAMADALMLLIGGMLANGEVLGPAGPARMAIATAETIVRQYCPGAVGSAAA